MVAPERWRVSAVRWAQGAPGPGASRGTECPRGRSIKGPGAPRGTALFACGQARRAVLGTCAPGDGAGTLDEQSHTHALGATCPRVFTRGAVSSTLVLDPTRPTGLPSRGRCRVVARSRPRREPQPGARACSVLGAARLPPGPRARLRFSASD